jgi:hypothetical protein
LLTNGTPLAGEAGQALIVEDRQFTIRQQLEVQLDRVALGDRGGKGQQGILRDSLTPVQAPVGNGLCPNPIHGQLL